MQFLENSPLGPLAVRDFRIEQLILVDGVVKLTDLDDIDGKRRPCATSQDCFVGGLIGNTTLPCKENICVDFAAKSNLYSVYKTFLVYSLDNDNPEGIREDLKQIARRIETFTIGFAEILSQIRAVVSKIQLGVYSMKYIQKGQ